VKKSREQKKDETREAIISTAIDLFSEKGYSDAQMKEVYEKAGIGKKTLYRYFSSKEDLALTVEKRILEQITEKMKPALGGTINSSENAFEKLTKIYKKQLLGFIYENPKLFKFTAQFDANVTGLHDEIESGREFTHYIKGMKDFTGQLIEEGQGDGSIRKDINPLITSITWNNALMGLVLRIYAREENILAEQGMGIEMAGHFIDMFLDYIKEG